MQIYGSSPLSLQLISWLFLMREMRRNIHMDCGCLFMPYLALISLLRSELINFFFREEKISFFIS